VRLLRLLGIGTAIVTAALALTSQTGALAATSIPAVSYYLALGDSLAQGYQPGLGTTDQGAAPSTRQAWSSPLPRLVSAKPSRTANSGSASTLSAERARGRRSRADHLNHWDEHMLLKSNLTSGAAEPLHAVSGFPR
jgi:hypothetical protein